MEDDFLTTAAFLALLAIAAFFCLFIGVYFLRWLFEEWRLAGPRAIERLRKRLAREQEQRLYEEQLREMQEESELAAFGRKLMAEISSPLFQKAKAVFGQLRAARTGLGSYATVCFRTLQYLVASCEGLTQSPWELADLAPERRKAQLQVLAIATAALQALDEINNDVLFDSSLVAWKLNLQKVRYELCPNCPVVSSPETYRGGCPVMVMTCEVKTDDEKERVRQQS